MSCSWNGVLKEKGTRCLNSESLSEFYSWTLVCCGLEHATTTTQATTA